MWKIGKIKLDDIILFILLWLPIYQDSILYNYIGSYGHAPITIFSIFALGYCIFLKKAKVNNLLKMLIYLIMILIIVSFFSTTFYYLFNGTDVFGNENMFIKMIKGNMYFISITCYIISVVSLSYKKNKEFFLKHFKNIFIFLGVILVIEYFNLPSAFSSLHAIRPNNYYRIRLLTAESSWTTSIILIYFTMSFAYGIHKKSIFGIIFSIVLFMLFVLTTTSKSLLILFLLLIGSIILLNMKNMSKKSVLLFLILCFIVFVSVNMMINKLSELFMYDIQNYTSVSTRVFSWYCGIEMLLENPIGYGTSIYIPKIHEKYIENLSKFNEFAWFNQSEILALIKSNSDSSLAIKSGIIQYGIYWGGLGVIIFSNFLFKIYKEIDFGEKNNLENDVYKACLICIVIYIMFVGSFDYKYEIWSFVSYMICLREMRGEKNVKNNSNVFTTVSSNKGE